MKLKIKIRRVNKEIPFPEIIEKGEWIDLRASMEMKFEAPKVLTTKDADTGKNVKSVEFDYTLIPLGVAMKLPKGFEAVVAPRSGTFKNFGLIETNSMGVIDNSYSGNNDEWKFPALAFRNIIIPKGDRICQFRIQPSQKASVWTKLKWLFSSGIKLVEVDSLDDIDRKGFSSTGTR